MCREAEIGGRMFRLRKSDHAVQRRQFRFRLGETIQEKVLGRKLAHGARGKVLRLRKLACGAPGKVLGLREDKGRR